MDTKILQIRDEAYVFEKLEELIEMLKEDGYEISLVIKKKGKISGMQVKL